MTNAQIAAYTGSAYAHLLKLDANGHLANSGIPKETLLSLMSTAFEDLGMTGSSSFLGKSTHMSLNDALASVTVPNTGRDGIALT